MLTSGTVSGKVCTLTSRKLTLVVKSLLSFLANALLEVLLAPSEGVGGVHGSEATRSAELKGVLTNLSGVEAVADLYISNC